LEFGFKEELAEKLEYIRPIVDLTSRSSPLWAAHATFKEELVDKRIGLCH
jgi:hypothetical protein